MNMTKTMKGYTNDWSLENAKMWNISEGFYE